MSSISWCPYWPEHFLIPPQAGPHKLLILSLGTWHIFEFIPSFLLCILSSNFQNRKKIKDESTMPKSRLIRFRFLFASLLKCVFFPLQVLFDLVNWSKTIFVLIRSLRLGVRSRGFFRISRRRSGPWFRVGGSTKWNAHARSLRYFHFDPSPFTPGGEGKSRKRKEILRRRRPGAIKIGSWHEFVIVSTFAKQEKEFLKDYLELLF